MLPDVMMKKCRDQMKLADVIRDKCVEGMNEKGLMTDLVKNKHSTLAQEQGTGPTG